MASLLGHLLALPRVDAHLDAQSFATTSPGGCRGDVLQAASSLGFWGCRGAYPSDAQVVLGSSPCPPGCW